jgi:hypothetical protein
LQWQRQCQWQWQWHPKLLGQGQIEQPLRPLRENRRENRRENSRENRRGYSYKSCQYWCFE